MRIWSLNPELLDSKGLVALWRETLLAKKVLEGRTIGYKNHPQLIRFKNTEAPISYINTYLSEVFSEANKRGFNFDVTKFERVHNLPRLQITIGQLQYEYEHLALKIRNRDQKFYASFTTKTVTPHPLFETTEGEIADWEILKQ